MSVALGPDDWIVLSGLEEVKRFGMASEAISRPLMKNLFSLYCYGPDQGLGVIFADGHIWQNQRKFMAKALKEMSVGNRPFLDHITDEMELFTRHVRGKCGDNQFDGKNFFDVATLNIIWRLATGHRFDYDDKATRDIIENVEAFTMEPLLGIVGTIRHARYMPVLGNVYKRVKDHMDAFKDKIQKQMDLVDDDNCYVSRFDREKASETFTSEQLVCSLLDFFTGGSGTVAKTLSFCLLYMLHFPEWQEKIRKGQEVEAFIREVQRLCSILPISPPRMVTKDFEFFGYQLKKGQKVQMNLYAMHRNPSHWGADADHFRPSRFLDAEGQLKVDEWLQPYGYGKRKCLGEKVADNTIRVFLVHLVRQFEFSCIGSLPDTETVGGLTLMPKDFTVQVRPI